MKTLIKTLIFSACLQPYFACASISDLPEGLDPAQVEAVLEAPTAAELKAALALDESQEKPSNSQANVLLSKAQLQEAKKAIKTLKIGDFMLLRYDGLKLPTTTLALSQMSLNVQSSFPGLSADSGMEGKNLQLSQLLFNDFAQQAKALSLKTTKSTVKLASSWENGAWALDGESSMKNPGIDNLTTSARVWAGPVVSDNVVRYLKKGDKTIARVYFNSDAYGRYEEPTRQLMQGIWSVAMLKGLAVAVSIDVSTNVYELSYPLIFNLRLPLHIVTPDGLVPATLVAARLNRLGECNTGSWIELELDQEQPLAMWAFAVLPKPEQANTVTIQRETYKPGTFIYDDEYMVGTRKMLGLSWKDNALPPIKIIATRFDYNIENYDEKGKLKNKSTLGSTWGSEVFLDNKVTSKVQGEKGKWEDHTHYGDLIHAGEFGDCPAR